uniref:Uncharacterized protein n=1 Tax=Romanomermis culicivorax TaxID=13658 RepID=A0A915HV09_ROMCU
MLNKTDGAYQWDNIRRSEGGSHSLQTQRARDLMTRAGLQNHTGPGGIQELEIIQRTLHEYKIKVFSKDVYGAIIYEGNVDSEKVIHLYHHKCHYTTFVLQDELIKYCDSD